MFRKVWPLVLAAVSLGINAYVIVGILPQIAGSLQTTVGAIGLGVTAFTGAYAVAGPTLSHRLSARSTKGTLLFSLGLFNLANLITTLAPSLTIFLGARVLAGAGAGILTAVATATAASLVHSQHRGKAMSSVTFGLSTGTVAGVPIGMLIGQQIGWRWTMGLVVAIGLVSMIALIFRSGTLPPIPSERGAEFRVLKSPHVLTGIAVAFIFGVTSLGLYTYLLPISQGRGLSSFSFAFIWIWGIGGVLGSLLAGRLIHGVGSHRLLPLIALALLASFSVIAFVPHPVWWMGAVLVWGACGWGSVPTLAHALTHTRHTSTTVIVAFQMAAIYLGSAVGSAFGSALLSHGTTAEALPVWAMGAQALAVILTFIVAALSQPETTKATQSTST